MIQKDIKMPSDDLKQVVKTFYESLPETSPLKAIALECLESIGSTTYRLEIVSTTDIADNFTKFLEVTDVASLTLMHLALLSSYFELNNRMLKALFNVDLTNFQVADQSKAVCTRYHLDVAPIFRCFFCTHKYTTECNRNRHLKRCHPDEPLVKATPKKRRKAEPRKLFV